LEIVFSKLLPGNNGNASDLLKMRAVTHRWKEIVDGMLELQSRAAYLTLQPSSLGSRTTPSVTPTIFFTLQEDQDCQLIVAHCPKYIFSREPSQASNPFPSKSICIKGKESFPFRNTQELLYQECLAKRFLSDYCHNLKFLSLQSFQFKDTDFICILSRVPNLVGLKTSDLTIKPSQSAGNITHLPLPKLPHLVSLQIGLVISDDAGPETIQAMTRWLLNAYSKQLTSLAFSYSTSFNDSLKLKDYPMLNELKIEGANLQSLLPTENLPLIRLIITHITWEGGYCQPSFADLTSLIEKFSNTLEYLHLDFDMNQLRDEMEPKKVTKSRGGSGSAVVFPKMKVFGFRYREHMAILKLREYFLPKFPALKTLQLFRLNFIGEETEPPRNAAEEELRAFRQRERFLSQQQRLWDVCKNCGHLKCVQVFPAGAGSQSFLLKVGDL